MKQLLDKYLEAIREFLPETVTQPAIGLDIGASSCKAIEVILTENSFEITNWAIEPIIGADEGTAIKRVLRKIDAQSRNLSTAISGKGTLIRYIDMPRMSFEDLKNSINLEADKHFPFANDQIYIDCFILEQLLKENKMHILVAAAKRDIVEQRIKLLSGLGLKADFIATNSIALANLFNFLKNKEDQAKGGSSAMKEGAVALLDIGHAISSLIIFKDKLPYFTRDIFIGGQDFDKSISNILAVDLTEAGKIKHEPNDRVEEAQKACESVLMNLVSELRLSFDYFATEKGVSISKLFLTGGSSQLTGLPEFFAKNLDIQVEHWNPLPVFKLSESLKVEEGEINKKINQLGVALGLALYQHD